MPASLSTTELLERKKHVQAIRAVLLYEMAKKVQTKKLVWGIGDV